MIDDEYLDELMLFSKAWYRTLTEAASIVVALFFLSLVTVFMLWVFLCELPKSIDVYVGIGAIAVFWFLTIRMLRDSPALDDFKLYWLRVLTPLKKMPIYINDEDEKIRELACWRLKNGK